MITKCAEHYIRAIPVKEHILVASQPAAASQPKCFWEQLQCSFVLSVIIHKSYKWAAMEKSITECQR